MYTQGFKNMIKVIFLYNFVRLIPFYSYYKIFIIVPVLYNAVPCSLFYVVQLLSYIQLFVIPWTVACQASLSSTISWSLLKFMSNESMMPSNHLIVCIPLLLYPSIFPNIRVFSNESVICIRQPKYWSVSLPSVLPMNIQD